MNVKTFFEWFIHGRTDGAMLARTVAEAVASYISVNLATIVGLLNLTPEAEKLVMGLFMVVYTAVLGFIRKKRETTEASV